MRRNHLRLTAIVGICLLAVAGLAFGQAKSGNIYGRVVAEDGSSLPGVTVTLTGGGAPQVSSQTRGDIRFRNLRRPQTYTLKFESQLLERERRVGVNTARTTTSRGDEVAQWMLQSRFGEAPLLDTARRHGRDHPRESGRDSVGADPGSVVQTVHGAR